MKTYTLTLLLALMSAGAIRAQNFENLIGLRGGFSSGITFQHHMSESTALEFILQTRYQGFGIVGLYEIHKPAFDVKGMYWYYGVGGHIGNYPWDDGDSWRHNEDHSATTLIGVDGILGLEYYIPEIPVQFSIDYKPAFNLLGDTRFWGDEGGLSIRYCW